MIIVTGSVEAKSEHRGEVLALCIEHVQRSRKETGCLDHRVSIDAENKCRFVFIEHWETMFSLKTHFELEDSKAFVRNLMPLVASKPDMQIYKTEKIAV